MSERVVDIVEDYLERNINQHGFTESELKSRIQKCRIPEELIDELIIEIKDELNREIEHRKKLKSDRRTVYLGVFLFVAVGTFSILLALGYIIEQKLNMSFLNFAVMGVAFMTVSQAVSYARKSKKNKGRRELKYSVYDKY